MPKIQIESGIQRRAKSKTKGEHDMLVNELELKENEMYVIKYVEHTLLEILENEFLSRPVISESCGKFEKHWIDEFGIQHSMFTIETTQNKMNEDLNTKNQSDILSFAIISVDEYELKQQRRKEV